MDYPQTTSKDGMEHIGPHRTLEAALQPLHRQVLHSVNSDHYRPHLVWFNDAVVLLDRKRLE